MLILPHTSPHCVQITGSSQINENHLSSNITTRILIIMAEPSTCQCLSLSDIQAGIQFKRMALGHVLYAFCKPIANHCHSLFLLVNFIPLHQSSNTAPRLYSLPLQKNERAGTSLSNQMIHFNQTVLQYYVIQLKDISLHPQSYHHAGQQFKLGLLPLGAEFSPQMDALR